MAITIPVLMTRATHSALMQFREQEEEAGESMSLTILAGGLVGEALQQRGYLKRPEYVKAGGE